MSESFAPTAGIIAFLVGTIFLTQLISWNSPTGAAALARCIDSDGQTASVPGTVTVIDAGERTYADSCKTPTIVSEKTCSGSSVKTTDIKCNECITNSEGIGYCKK